MKKYIYFLAEAPQYPNEIFARSPQEVKNLIMESISDESQILKIIEAPVQAQSEQSNKDQARLSNENAIVDELDPNDFENAQDFFNSVTKLAENAENRQEVSTSNNSSSKETTVEVQPVAVASEPEPKFFEEAGIQFMLKGSKLYKRTWVNVSDDEIPEYRVISRSNNKLMSSDKYKIEKLEWVEL